MNYSDDIFEKLVATIEEATSQAAIDLFNSTNETFYFFVLSTTGEALAPFVSAWSYEALKKTKHCSKIGMLTILQILNGLR